MDPVVVKSALIAAAATLVQGAALAQQAGLADAAAVPSPTSGPRAPGPRRLCRMRVLSYLSLGYMFYK
jgi:hypothetical protein